MTDKNNPTWINKKDLAARLGISVQALGKWGVEPVGKVGREVFFTLRDVIDNRIENAAKNDNLGNLGTTADEKEETRQLARNRQREEYLLAKERRIGQQQKNEIQAGTMIPTEFATFALSRLAARVASILDTLPLTIRRAHPDLEARHIDSITSEVAKARNTAAEADEILPELVEEYVETINATG